MIKNIVFDVGWVLADYLPMETCRKLTTTEQDAVALHFLVFRSPEWVWQDMGVYSDEEVIAKVQKRTDRADLKQAIAAAFTSWTERSLPPRPGMIALANELKAKGMRLYILSNASRLMAQTVRANPQFGCFDGMLFSSDVLYLKPQREIYRTLFEKYGLEPSECYFIDDLQVNIDGAAAMGMSGHCFTEEALLRQALHQIDCLCPLSPLQTQSLPDKSTSARPAQQRHHRIR